ncbi:phosphoinositide-interacting protein-like [Paralichthys olivaceus]|uniref:phosphoinositide-interacting protein-like n=1 Tax=Paralichthys olivaceus TaxID=8255 RepID=UPI0037504749
MLSTEVTTYSDPSSQDREEFEASSLLLPLQDGDSPPYQDAVPPSGWSLTCRAMVVISVGMLLFGSGTVLSLLFFTQVGNVPYLLGPLFLSVGLMFLVTGLVWMSILKQSLEPRSFTTVN